MAYQIDPASRQNHAENQIKIVTFSASKLANLGILSMIIVSSSFVTLLWASPELYFVFFGAFVLSPIIVLGSARLKSIISGSDSFSLSGLLLIVLIVSFVSFNVYQINNQLSLILVGFFSNVFLLVAWTLMPYSTTIESKINDEVINLFIKHHRLFIGISTTQISIKKGEKVTLKPSRSRRGPFFKSFVFHHLLFWADGSPNLIPFLPFSEKGSQLAAKMYMVFMNSDCELIIDSSLLNSKNLFMRLIIPKVSVHHPVLLRSRNEVYTPKNMVIDHFSTFEEADTAMFEVNPDDYSVLSINSFVSSLSDPKFKKSRLVSIKKLLATLLIGLIYFIFGLLIIYVSWAITYVVFLKGWYAPFVIQLYLTLILTAFVVMFFFQGIVYPLFLLFGRPKMEYKVSGSSGKSNGEEVALLKYRIGFVVGMKIKLPTILEPKIIKSNDKYAIVISLDSMHQLRLPYGKIT